MSGLLSIAPLTEIVSVRGHDVSVHGVSAQGIASMLNRFPDLRKQWATGQWDVEQLLAFSDDIMAAIIAAGCPQHLDEANAANLALDEKAELLGAVIRLTMPRGPVPFAETLAKLMGSVSGGQSAKAPATKSQPPSKG